MEKDNVQRNDVLSIPNSEIQENLEEISSSLYLWAHYVKTI